MAHSPEMNYMNSMWKTIKNYSKKRRYERIFQKYRDFTMVPFENFVPNLELCDSIKGCVVECGVWRGGMSASMAEVLGNDRTYYLFDSFEGLPEAKEIDGTAALEWQKDKDAPYYYDNCKAEIEFARKAMSLSNAGKVKIIKGWFNETLPVAAIDEPIAVLRLDGDWYDSTMDCMENLYPKVAEGGLVLLDDYYFWNGFSKAIHDYLSKYKLPVRINQWKNSNLYYIIKKSDI
jgi:O-methyltransferase